MAFLIENGQLRISCRVIRGVERLRGAEVAGRLEVLAVLLLFLALLALLFLLLLPLGHFFFAHLVVLAGGEHDSAAAVARNAARANALLASGQAAHAADGLRYC